MATVAEKKQEIAKQGQKQAEIIVNNALIDGLSKQLKEKEKYGLTFPADYNPTNALNGAYLILQETVDKNGKPVMQSCTQPSIARSLMDMVTLGLSAQKKQCYFIPYGGKLQCQPSYHGNKAMAHRYGAVDINAEVIYEGDEFKYHIENGRKVLDRHIQDFRNIDLTKIVGAYCVVKLSDGSTYMEVMNINQIENAWKKRQGGYTKGKAGATHTDFADMMAKKTVTSRACKQIVQQYGDVFTVDAFEHVESHANDDIVEADVEHDIQSEANSVDFHADEEIETADIQEVKEADESTAEDAPKTSKVDDDTADSQMPDCFQ